MNKGDGGGNLHLSTRKMELKPAPAGLVLLVGGVRPCLKYTK